MKKLAVLFLFISIGAFGQTTHQTDIISFVNHNVGKKVGKGICYELVQGAIQQYDSYYDMGAIKKDSDRYGEKVKQKDVQPGDIVTQKGSQIDHLCIVYKISNDSIFVAEQNTNGSLKKSVVEINYLDFTWIKKMSPDVKVSYYRPK